MELEDPPPICSSCNHPHHPTQKCPICGHTGKGKTYLLVAKTTAPTDAALHFDAFDKRMEAQMYKSSWALAKILRMRVFVEEGGIGEEVEFQAGEDERSRHVLGLLGDAPVVYARWRVEEGGGGPLQNGGGGGAAALANGGTGQNTSNVGNGGGGSIAIIDRLAILPAYRGRKFSSRAMEFLLSDIEAFAQEMQQTQGWVIGSVLVSVPMDVAQILGEKLQSRAGFQLVGAPYEDEARKMRLVRMQRVRQPQQQQGYIGGGQIVPPAPQQG